LLATLPESSYHFDGAFQNQKPKAKVKRGMFVESGPPPLHLTRLPFYRACRLPLKKEGKCDISDFDEGSHWRRAEV